MACLLKAPRGKAKGCVSFTTPERDHLIATDPALRTLMDRLRTRFVIGLHHNWHDHAFSYDPQFDFSMAGEDDLTERDNRDFLRIGVDACNFAPTWFDRHTARTPFWDVFNVARAVDFKGIPQFFIAIRQLYDRGVKARVLFLCSVSQNERLTGIDDIRLHFEEMFSPVERQLFTLMTMDWDYPFPLDLETLAFFYRSSRIFVHPAPNERRCRTAAYAWASGIPVVGRANVASILPADVRTPPYYFTYDHDDDLADAISRALEGASLPGPHWDMVCEEFQAVASARRLDAFLHERFAPVSDAPVVPTALDIRLGRHHRLSVGGNRIDQDLTQFCEWLLAAEDSDMDLMLQMDDPENWVAGNRASMVKPGGVTSLARLIDHLKPRRKTAKQDS